MSKKISLHILSNIVARRYLVVLRLSSACFIAYHKYLHRKYKIACMIMMTCFRTNTMKFSNLYFWSVRNARSNAKVESLRLRIFFIIHCHEQFNFFYQRKKKKILRNLNDWLTSQYWIWSIKEKTTFYWEILHVTNFTEAFISTFIWNFFCHRAKMSNQRSSNTLL